MSRVILNNHLFVNRDVNEVLAQLKKDCKEFIIHKNVEYKMEDFDYTSKTLGVYYKEDTNKVTEVRIG